MQTSWSQQYDVAGLWFHPNATTSALIRWQNQETRQTRGLPLRSVADAEYIAQVCYLLGVLGWGSSTPSSATSDFHPKLVCLKLPAVAGFSEVFQRPVYEDKLAPTFQWSNKESFFFHLSSALFEKHKPGR